MKKVWKRIRIETYIVSMPGMLDGLNDAQREAVTATEGRVLVVAGPGTGKTLTIVRRIAHLMEQGVRPEEILAVTFTNRAAREMRERIHALIGARDAGMFIGTFHLLGLKLMRASVGEPFTICGRDEQLALLKPVVGSAAKALDAAERISRFKNDVEPLDGETEAVFAVYETSLRERGMRDFDDLIRVPAGLLGTGGEAGPPGSFRHIIVDEYQDISPAQYRLLKGLVGRDSTLCAVGDSDQAIYAFRGADLQNFLNFQADFPAAHTVVLQENYRSTAMVLGAADAVIKHNRRRIEKSIAPRREGGSSVTVVSAPDERSEAESIVREIEARVGGTSHYRLAGAKAAKDFEATSCSFADFAVLFRTNAQARVIREAFDEWGIPCQVVGDRHALNGKALVDRLRAHLDTLPPKLDVAEFLRGVWQEAGAGGAAQGLIETLAAAYGHLPPREAITEIINELSLLTGLDAYDPRADAVTLLTMHAAKGLEFSVVFITGVEEGLIPYTLAKNDADIEEERRLFYVGMTRAKDELFLLHARNRFIYGQRRAASPSSFLAAIPKEFVRQQMVSDRAKRKPKQEGLF
jgi:superfamily I DNA/RNA helicase